MQLQISTKSKFMVTALRNPDIPKIDIASKIYPNFSSNKFQVLKEISPNIVKNPGLCLAHIGVTLDDSWIGDAFAESCWGIQLGDNDGIEPVQAIYYYGISNPEFVTIDELGDDNEFILGGEIKFYIDKDRRMLYDLVDEDKDISEFLDEWGMSLSDGMRIVSPAGLQFLYSNFADTLIKGYHMSLTKDNIEYMDYLAIEAASSIEGMGLLIDNVTIEELIASVELDSRSPIHDIKDEQFKALAIVVYGTLKLVAREE